MRRLRPAKASVGSVERLARVLASRKHQRRRCRWHLGRVLGASGPALARTVAWRDVHCGVRRSIGGWRIDEFLFFRNFNGQGPTLVASGRWSTLEGPISKELTCSINL